MYAYLARYGNQSWKDIDEMPVNQGIMFFHAVETIIKKESGKD